MGVLSEPGLGARHRGGLANQSLIFGEPSHQAVNKGDVGTRRLFRIVSTLFMQSPLRGPAL